MRQSNVSGTRNDLLQLISDQDALILAMNTEILAKNTEILTQLALKDVVNLTDTVVDTFAGNDGSHASTLRVSYLVPAATRSVIDVINLVMQRTTADVAPYATYIYVAITPNGGASTNIITAQARKNAVGEGIDKTLLMGITLQAGDKLDIYTQDLGTIGFHSIHIGFGISEYSVI